MNRIRVMHVIIGLGTGGTEMALRRVVTGVDPNLFEHVICSTTTFVVDPLPEVRITCLGRPFGKPGTLVPGLVRLFRKERPMLVHSRNWGTIEAILAARLAGVPAVVHSEHGREFGGMNGEPLRRRLFRRFCYPLASCVFTVSDELRAYQARQSGMSESRFRVIPNGVDLTQFRPDPEERSAQRQQMGAGPKTFVVGSVNRFDRVKDQVTLLRAADAVAGRGVDLRLVVVGDGPLRSQLEQTAKDLPNLAGRAVFPGMVQKVRSWLNSFDAFVLPSLSEGMSNTLLEAMAVGLPPVATRVGGNVEVIEEGRCGLFFAPRDEAQLAAHLSELARNEELRHSLGSRARQRIESQFSLTRMMNDYKNLYCELLRPHARVQAALNQL